MSMFARTRWSLLLLALVPFFLNAKEKEWNLKDWLNTVQKRIRRTERRQGQRVAVAAIRGAKEDAPKKLYWKGKSSNQAVTDAELQEFKTAVSMVSAGQKMEGQSALDAFLKKYPTSALKSDAENTLALVQKEPAATETKAQ